MIDTAGNIINPETKEIIQRSVPDYIPTKEEIETQINAKPSVEPLAEKLNEIMAYDSQGGFNLDLNLSIQEQIVVVEKLLLELKEKKKQEIARRKAELAELEAV